MTDEDLIKELKESTGAWNSVLILEIACRLKYLRAIQAKYIRICANDGTAADE